MSRCFGLQNYENVRLRDIIGGMLAVKRQMSNFARLKFINMKIALPTRNDGTIDSHFGHCEHYTICTVSEDKKMKQYETMASPVGCGCKSDIAPRVHDMGVTVMLAGNMGDGAVNVLTRNGIKVIRGCSGKVEDVVTDFLNGTLSDSGLVCHEHECHDIKLPDGLLPKRD